MKGKPRGTLSKCCLRETEKYFEYFRIVGILAGILTESLSNASQEPTFSVSLILAIAYCMYKCTFIFDKQFLRKSVNFQLSLS
jgi:hypothetical protein